jgi:hypothetical protein
MNDDAISAAARAVLIENYLDVKVQLEKGTGTRPVLWLLARQRNQAVDALRKLIEIDASETEAIRLLQAEVRLYGDLVESCRDLLVRGREADREIAEAERAALSDLLESNQDAEAMGLAPTPED